MTVLETTDIEQLRRYFDRNRKRATEETEGLSDGQLRFKPGGDRWSIAELLEHMVTVQERVLGPILGQLAQAPAPGPEHDRERIDAIVMEKIPDRSVRAKAPEHLNPTGTWSREAAIERFARNYQRLLEYVENTPGLRDHVLEAPPLRLVSEGAFTKMDGYQWVLTVAAHDDRHIRQIQEVKSDPNFPGK